MVKKKNKIEIVESQKLQYNTVIKTSIVILMIFAAFYLITGLITGDINFNGKQETYIQYSEIIAGETLNREENNYLVIYYDKTGEDTTTFESAMYNYQTVEGSLKYYTVNMASALNQMYKDDVANLMVEQIKDLKITDFAMIEVKEGKIVNTWDNKDAILEYLQ